jgi:hypothetical protein
MNESRPQDAIRILSLTGANPTGDNFGWSVAMNEQKTLAVGAIAQDGRGAVYIYRNGNYDATPEKIPAPSSVSNNGNFGFSVAFYQNTLVVGAPYSSVGGRQNAGMAFIYDLNLNDYVNKVQSLPSNPTSNAEYGRSVSIYSEAMVVGSRNYQR